MEWENKQTLIFCGCGIGKWCGLEAPIKPNPLTEWFRHWRSCVKVYSLKTDLYGQTDFSSPVKKGKKATVYMRAGAHVG